MRSLRTLLQFLSKSLRPTSTILLSVLPVTVFNLSPITEGAVAYAIKMLKSNQSPGPDLLPHSVLKFCSSSFIPLLVSIFNLSIRTHTYPSMLKRSFVRPIPKKGKLSDVKNYRGISIINSV